MYNIIGQIIQSFVLQLQIYSRHICLENMHVFNPLALELDIYSLAHHLCKMWIFMNQEV